MKVIIALLFVATLAVARRGGRPEEGRGGHGGGHSGHKPNIADICAEVASNCPSGTQFRFFDGPCDQLPTSGRPGKPGRRENPCAAGTDSATVEGCGACVNRGGVASSTSVTLNLACEPKMDSSEEGEFAINWANSTCV